MKKCDEVQELISAYIDGETNGVETSAMFFHLGECPECRAFMRSVLQLQSALRENGLLVRSEMKPATARLWKRTFAVSYPVAAAIAVFMLLSSFLVSSRMLQPPVTVKSTQTEYVYLTSFPPVVVVGSRPADTKPN
jgi:anti-sigma factor RsiW